MIKIHGMSFALKDSAVTLGKFDGIHRGHRILLEEILSAQGLHATVFTFDHILQGKRIYSMDEQSEILGRLGIEREIIFPFCEETRAMSAQDFVEEILIRQLGTKLICVGEDFHFGRNRQGDVHFLQGLSEKYGYQLKVYPKLQEDNINISSSRIRQALQAGRLDKVNALLGEPYFIAGRVVHGQALGRTLGAPTANILPDQDKLLPQYGVYAASAQLDGRQYAGVANLGRKPTVGGEGVSLETTFFDFDGDLYDQRLSVSLHAFLRPEQQFSDLEELKQQIIRDRKQARKWFLDRKQVPK